MKMDKYDKIDKFIATCMLQTYIEYYKSSDARKIEIDGILDSCQNYPPNYVNFLNKAIAPILNITDKDIHDKNWNNFADLESKEIYRWFEFQLSNLFYHIASFYEPEVRIGPRGLCKPGFLNIQKNYYATNELWTFIERYKNDKHKFSHNTEYVKKITDKNVDDTLVAIGVMYTYKKSYDNDNDLNKDRYSMIIRNIITELKKYKDGELTDIKELKKYISDMALLDEEELKKFTGSELEIAKLIVEYQKIKVPEANLINNDLIYNFHWGWINVFGAKP